eukprot:scaffold408_cov388-Prasinococcus_capsulatus_cf.AAC.17
MLLLSQLFKRSRVWEAAKINVFCIGEVEADIADLKRDVQSFLYDLRMKASVKVLSIRNADKCKHCGNKSHFDSEFQESKKMVLRMYSCRDRARHDMLYRRAAREHRVANQGGTPSPRSSEAPPRLDEQSLDHSVYTALKLNATIRVHSRDASLVLLSMPPNSPEHPNVCYMSYLDIMLRDLPATLVVRGYRRSVATIFQ